MYKHDGALALAESLRQFAAKTSDDTLHLLADDIFGACSDDNDQVCIVNTGLLKAGKSSLFNALVGNEDEFATAEVRCTVANQHSRQTVFTLVDTPGIDATDADTNEAEATLRQADLILFVHNVKAGELDQQELQFLERLSSFFPDKNELSSRLLPVFSRIDEVEQNELAAIVQATLSQWEALLSFGPDKYFLTSSKRYFTGVRQNKHIFVHKSGIEDLQGFLKEQSGILRHRKDALMKGRLFDRLSGLQSNLTAMHQKVTAAAGAMAKERKAKQYQLKRQARDMFAALSTRARAYLDMPTGEPATFPNYIQSGGIWMQSTGSATPDDVVKP